MVAEAIIRQFDTGEEADDDFDIKATLATVAESLFTERGDVYVIDNKHRLMCGDATDASDIATLMDGRSARLTVTDPPYNVDYESAAGKIINDRQSDAAFDSFLLSAFRNAYNVMKPGAAVYIFHAETIGASFRRAACEAGFDIRQCLIWVKSNLVLGRQDYQWKHEPILYGWIAGEPHYFSGDRTQTTVIESAPPDIKKMKKTELLAFTERLLEEQHTSVIHDGKPNRSDEHPTMKPVSLVGRLISNSSKPGWIVLDPFGGSGSTLVACVQLRRTCFTMELDPKYCDVIVRRYVAWCESHNRKATVTLLRAGQSVKHPFIVAC